ncbi:MAG: streptophobe family protein [Blastococcus sp.]
MTGSYCSSCGAEKTPGASFCASCGSAVAAPPAGPPAAPAAGQWAAPHQGTPHQGTPHQGTPYQGSAAESAPIAAQPQYTPVPVPAPQPASASYSGPPAPQVPYPGGQPAQVPYPGAQQPWAGAPQQGQAAPPPAAPWGAATGAPQPTGTPGRSTIDALLTGDWGGAARSAGLAVGVMAAISLVGMLLITEGGIGFRETMALILAGVCLAVGGDGYAEAAVESFGTSFSLGLLPLTVTLAGLGVLGWSFARQLRSSASATAADSLLQGVRTALVFTAFFLPLSLLTRYQADDSDVLDVSGRLGVGVVSTVIGALLFAVAALGLTWVFHRSTALPGRVAALRDKALAPLLGAVAVFSVGLLAVVAALIYGLIEESDKLIQTGVALLGAGNGALASVLWSAGVPLNVEGTASTPLSELSPSGSESVDLFTFTDGSAWFWLAPVLLLATMVLVATALAVRQNTVEDARREGFRFAGALALVAFLATLLLRIGVDGAAIEFSTAGDGSAMFNPIVAAFVLAVWGVLTGLLAPVVAAKVSSGFVTTVRSRFGAEVEPTPPAV